MSKPGAFIESAARAVGEEAFRKLPIVPREERKSGRELWRLSKRALKRRKHRLIFVGYENN